MGRIRRMARSRYGFSRLLLRGSIVPITKCVTDARSPRAIAGHDPFGSRRRTCQSGLLKAFEEERSEKCRSAFHRFFAGLIWNRKAFARQSKKTSRAERQGFICREPTRRGAYCDRDAEASSNPLVLRVKFGCARRRRRTAGFVSEDRQE